MRYRPGWIGLLTAALLSAATPSRAQDFRRGLSAYNRGDYAESLRQWQPLAEREDENAQEGLGYLYFKGLGVAQDFVTAASWFRRAAEQGQPEAQLLLGMLHYDGHGVSRSYVLAFKWCDLAQANGAAQAMPCREAAALRLSDAEMTESARLVTEWFARHRAEAGR